MKYIIDKEKVHEIMKSNGISTQKELADIIGITKNQLSVVLSAKTVPFKSTYINLCSALKVSPFDIITLDNDEEKTIEDTPVVENGIEEYIDVNTVTPKRAYKSVELFAGAGGLALGLEQAGFDEIGLVEIDKYAAETLRINRPKWNVIENDIIKVADDGIRKYIANGVDVDLVSGGYPCQAFSYAGHKLGLEDVRGTMFYYFAQIVEELKPKVFLAENVRGLISHDGGDTLKSMINIYESLGYNVTWHLIKANDYNVAQKRQRIIIVGIRKELGAKFILPKPYDNKPVLRDVLYNVPNSIGEKYPPKKKKVLELVPPGGYWRDLPEEIAKSYMGKSYYSGGGRTGMARRISWDEPCLTLTCSPAQKQTERCHPDETRPFTVREYARIQSFPDEWEFAGSMGQQYKQIGNAVPVEMAKAIGLSIIHVLNELED